MHDVDLCVWFTTFVVHDSCFNMFIFGCSSWLFWVVDILGFWDCIFASALLVGSIEAWWTKR